MENKLFDRIRNVECTEEDMREIISMAHKGKLDSTLPFDRYYRLRDILKCIELYEEGKLSHKLLTRWAVAYDALISGGVGYSDPKPDEDGEENAPSTVPTQKIITACIREWLDSLSICDDAKEADSEGECDDEDEDCYRLYTASEHKRVFEILDRIYNSLDEWDVVYTHEMYDFDENPEELEEIVLLFINREEKEFFVISNDSYDFHENKPEAAAVTYGEFEKKINELTENGYKAL